MEKLDRLGWADGMAILAYGVRIGIRVSERGHMRRIKSALPLGWKSTKSPRVDHLISLRVGGSRPESKIRRYHLLYIDSTRASRSMDLDEVLRTLELTLQFVVSLEAKNHLFVHAGVVAWKNRAILIPGRSFSGKTSLVDALVHAGATYYSDEFAVLDSKGRVHPYPIPIALREKRSSRSQKIRRPIRPNGKLGPLPIGMVIVSRFRDGSSWRPRLLSPAQSALALLANTVPARVRPQFTLATLRKALGTAPVLKGARGEAKETAEAILARLEKSTRRAA
jgi:hypothetical protein